MAGRMWGWLLLCDPPEQTAAEIAEALDASRGAISGTARILTSAGFIRRTTRRGDRREYFSAPPEALDSMLQSAGVVYRRLREIAEHGLAAAGDSSSAKARLEEFRDVIAFIETRAARASSTASSANGTRNRQRRRSPAGRNHSDRDHPDREAHQVLRLAPRDHRHRPRGRGRRGVRLPRAERRRQDDDDPDAARPHPPDVRPGDASSASRRPSIRSRSIAGSATCRASSRCTTS